MTSATLLTIVNWQLMQALFALTMAHVSMANASTIVKMIHVKMVEHASTEITITTVLCMCIDKNCSTLDDDCSTNPCANGATCVDQVGTFSCTCPPDSTNTLCNDTIDNCIDNDCVGGYCVDGVSSYYCKCFNGFFGSFCQNDISVCEDEEPCDNGVCSDEAGLNYTCTCDLGYFGTNCSEDIDVCQQDSPCENGGDCSNGPGLDYTCSCPASFTGTNCTTNVSTCNNDLACCCKNGGECVQDGPGDQISCNCTNAVTYKGQTCETPFCPENYCSQYGSCVIDGLEVRCVCDEGNVGDQCQLNINMCNSNSCMNGGTCVDGVGLEVSCYCSHDYTGTYCDETKYTSADTCTRIDDSTSTVLISSLSVSVGLLVLIILAIASVIMIWRCW